MSHTDRYALVYLSSAFRPQGFPPSRRLDPGATSRLCFTPLPPVGFVGRENSSLPQHPRDSRRAVLIYRGTVRRAPASRRALLREVPTHPPASKLNGEHVTQHTGPGRQSDAPAGRMTLPATPKRGSEPPLL